jgi:hypothetical protein
MIEPDTNNIAVCLVRLSEQLKGQQRTLDGLEETQQKVADALTTLAVVKERQSAQSDDLSRAFKDIGKLQSDVAKLVELANRSKGAWAVLLGGGSIVGAVVGWFLNHFFFGKGM